MGSLHYFLFFISSILTSNAAEFNLTFDTTPNLEQTMTSGHRVLNGIITIPDMFITKPSNRRRLKEIAPPPTAFTTPAPSTKLLLPVIVLIPPEGPQDRGVSIDGSQFNMHERFHAKIFDDLKDSLVSDGMMAVIQYDKRNCQAPFCDNFCPDICPNYDNSCNLAGECYNDTNITLSDLVHDAKKVLSTSHRHIQQYLNEDIVDFTRIWSIPVGFSFQGASIATYIASKYHQHLSHPDLQSTVINLMGSALPIDELLLHQLTLDTNATQLQHAIRTLKQTFERIKNATYNDTDMVSIHNDFLSDTKYVKYWKDWLNMTQDIDYGEIANFMAINSGSDDRVTPSSYEALAIGDIFSGNVTVDINIIQDINHYMIHVNDWSKGKWIVNNKIKTKIINFINDISGYLDDIKHWKQLNHSRSNHTLLVVEKEPIENDTVYKVLLYLAIMAIVLILALGIYFVIANNVCPYEFEENAIVDNNDDDRERERDRERRRRRRRRHRRERRRSYRHNRSVAHNERMVELNEPMIQSLLQPQDNENNNNGNVQAQPENPMLNEEYVD